MYFKTTSISKYLSLSILFLEKNIMDGKAHTLWMYFLILIAHLIQAAITTPPFCEKCRCIENQPNGTSIECFNTTISDILYKNSSWFDENNQTYPIIGLKLQKTDVGDLKTKFVKTNIFVLDLSNNSIKDVGDGVFSNLKYMELLILSDNEIEYLNPDCFKGDYEPGYFYPLHSLKVLILSNNKMHSLNQDLFEHTPKIENLSLKGNPFKVLDYHTTIAIGNLPYLKVRKVFFFYLIGLGFYGELQ